MMFALLCACSATLVAQEEKLAVTVVVLCEDAAAKKMIRESLLTHFRPLKDLEVVDKNGFSSLIVYAEKTVNDAKNPNGYAIAIAHTNCYELKLAYENLRGIDNVNCTSRPNCRRARSPRRPRTSTSPERRAS